MNYDMISGPGIAVLGIGVIVILLIVLGVFIASTVVLIVLLNKKRRMNRAETGKTAGTDEPGKDM